MERIMKSSWNRIFIRQLRLLTKEIQSYYERESRPGDLVNCILERFITNISPIKINKIAFLNNLVFLSCLESDLYFIKVYISDL